MIFFELFHLSQIVKRPLELYKQRKGSKSISSTSIWFLIESFCARCYFVFYWNNPIRGRKWKFCSCCPTWSIKSIWFIFTPNSSQGTSVVTFFAFSDTNQGKFFKRSIATSVCRRCSIWMDWIETKSSSRSSLRAVIFQRVCEWSSRTHEQNC